MTYTLPVGQRKAALIQVFHCKLKHRKLEGTVQATGSPLIDVDYRKMGGSGLSLAHAILSSFCAVRNH